ncbi:MAG: SurA N-terminal domain-containing protein [Elusimicrobiaceae bacterium]|nr:SurA N-terminal domain-containing protein [Elusimicrobiaceae bacterium]
MKINKIAVLTAALLMGANLLNAKVVDSTVATVNGQAILSSQYNKLVDTVMANYLAKNPQILQDPNNVALLKQEALNELITETLLSQNAKKEGIKVKDSEVADAVNEIKARFAVDQVTGQRITDQKVIDNNFNAELKKEGITYAQFESRIKDQIAIRKLIDNVVNSKVSAPTKEEVKGLYDDVILVMSGDQEKIKALPKDRLEKSVPLAAKLNQLTAEQIKISPIFVKFENNTPAEISAKEKLAKSIRKEAKKGKKTMIELIEKYSDDKSPLATGGEMILIKGVMPKDFDEKIFAVNVGNVSEPIKTDNGFYIIKVQEKKAKRDFTFEQVAPDMGQYLAAVKMQDEMLKYLNTLKEKSKIKVMIKFDEPAKPAAENSATPSSAK